MREKIEGKMKGCLLGVARQVISKIDLQPVPNLDENGELVGLRTVTLIYYVGIAK